MPKGHHYWSGEEIQPGDRVTYAGAPGTVRFVKIDGVCHPPEEQTGWPEEDGFMLHVPTTMGLVYLPSGEDEEDLDFLSRG